MYAIECIIRILSLFQTWLIDSGAVKFTKVWFTLYERFCSLSIINFVISFYSLSISFRYFPTFLHDNGPKTYCSFFYKWPLFRCYLISLCFLLFSQFSWVIYLIDTPSTMAILDNFVNHFNFTINHLFHFTLFLVWR